MKLVLKPSLEHMTVVKIAISLWNQSDIRDLISKLNFAHYSDYRNDEWEEIQERVTGKVPQLSLPKLLKEKQVCIIKFIGLEILKWMVFHHSKFNINEPAEFFWTPLGKLDRKKTAEVLVKKDFLDMDTRYKLACIYCLEYDIHKFWNMTHVSYEWPIIDFWSHYMKEIGSGNERINYEHQFFECARRGNKVAAEYFLEKLTVQERERHLVEDAKLVRDNDVLYFLLTKMDAEQQMEIFTFDPYRVLKCFLQWPLQSFFMDIANCIWDFINEKCFDLLLKRIVMKVSEGCKDWDYLKLFKDFWLKSPTHLKSSIVDELDKKIVLRSLFLVKDKENLKFILKDATLTVKKNIIYSHKTYRLLQSHILGNEWDFLEFFIRECLSSKNDILEFKAYIIHQCLNDNIVINTQKWDQVFGLSDDPIHKCKQSCLEGESSSSKRFCK